MANHVTRAAVVGASSLLGKELLEEIGASAPANWDLQALEPGTDAEGQLTSAGDEALVVHTLSESAFDGLDFVFFAGEPELTESYVEAAVKAGAAVLDLTGVTAERPGFLLRAPGLQQGKRPDLTTQGITVPHAAAYMLRVVEERLNLEFGVEQIAATILEPASQAGAAGVDELHQQTVNLLSFQELPKAVFDTQVAFNLLSSFGGESAFSLEATRARIRRELKLLGGDLSNLPVALSSLQAPVFHGYVVSCFVNLRGEASADALQAAMRGEDTDADADVTPSNQTATESGKLLVRVSQDPAIPKSAWVLLAVDNLRITVRNAVAAAIELAALRPAARVQ